MLNCTKLIQLLNTMKNPRPNLTITFYRKSIFHSITSCGVPRESQPDRSPKVSRAGLKKPQNEWGQGVMIDVGTSILSWDPRWELVPVPKKDFHPCVGTTSPNLSLDLGNT